MEGIPRTPSYNMRRCAEKRGALWGPNSKGEIGPTHMDLPLSKCAKYGRVMCDV